MAYKYEKFEKLSDAVKAWENRERLYIYHEGSDSYRPIPLPPVGVAFSSFKNHYRRIEVKPFECWAIVNAESKHLNIVSAGGESFIKGHKTDRYPDEAFKVIKLREVIEG